MFLGCFLSKCTAHHHNSHFIHHHHHRPTGNQLFRQGGVTLHVLHDAYRDGRVMSDHLPLLVVLALNAQRTFVKDKSATAVAEDEVGEDEVEDEEDALAAAIALSLQS